MRGTVGICIFVSPIGACRHRTLSLAVYAVAILFGLIAILVASPLLKVAMLVGLAAGCLALMMRLSRRRQQPEGSKRQLLSAHGLEGRLKETSATVGHQAGARCGYRQPSLYQAK